MRGERGEVREEGKGMSVERCGVRVRDEGEEVRKEEGDVSEQC